MTEPTKPTTTTTKDDPKPVSSAQPSTSVAKKDEDKDSKATSRKSKSADENSVVDKDGWEKFQKFGPPPIQTPEDAQWRFLQGYITKDELEDALGMFGYAGSLNALPTSVEPFDLAFERELPPTLLTTAEPKWLDVEGRLAVVDAKEEAREKSLDMDEDAKKLQDDIEEKQKLIAEANAAAFAAAHPEHLEK